MQQDAAIHTAKTRLAMTAAAFECVAQIQDSDRVTDLATALSPGRLAIIRCSDHATGLDHTTLENMLADGDFAWAGMIYSSHLGADWQGRVEAFHISELPQMIGRLIELRTVEAP